MKESIIKQMTEVVRDVMTNFTDDFYKYDMEALKDYDGRFVWIVAPMHTHLCKIGEEYLMDTLRSEEGVYAVCQRNTTNDFYLYSKDRLYEDEIVFYYDGDKMEQISFEEAKRIWEAVRSWALFMWQTQNEKELPTNFKIPVHFIMCGKIIRKLLESEKAANLLEEISRRRNGMKVNHTDCVNIYVETLDSLYFEKICKLNGESHRLLNGGIIYYNGKWHTHT